MAANRPLVWAASGFVLGIVAVSVDGLPHAWLAIVAGGAGLAALVGGRRRGRAGEIGLVLTFAACGVFVALARTQSAQDDGVFRFAAAQPGAEVTLEGRAVRPALYVPHVKKPPPNGPEWDGVSAATWSPSPRAVFDLEVDRIVVDGAAMAIDGRCNVRWSEAPATPYWGERVRVTGTLQPVLGHVNFGVPSSEEYYRSRGVHSVLRARGDDAARITGEAPWWYVPYWTSRFREHQAQRLAGILPESVVPFVFTVWLGDRARMAEEQLDAFLKTGTAHILAVSGIHMSVLYFMSSSILRAFMGRRKRSMFLIVLLLLFALFAGARISAFRAATMYIIYLAAGLADRDGDGPTALSIAALLFLFINPMLLYNPGFQLSFLSVASILLFMPFFDGLLSGLPRAVCRPIGATLSVQILPLMVATRLFHIIPFGAPLTNLFVVPILGVTLMLCWLATLASLVFEPAAVVFGNAVSPFVGVIGLIAELGSRIESSYLRVSTPSAFTMVLYYAALVVLFVPLRRVRPAVRGIAGAALLVVAVFFWSYRPVSPMVVFLDVGHGDATFIRGPDGTTVLIDGGDESPYVSMGRNVVAPFLRAEGVSRLDYVLVTHPDRDHVGGLFHVLDIFEVGEVMLGPNAMDRDLERRLLAHCDGAGVPVRRVAAGDALPMGEASLEVIHPPAAWPVSLTPNEHSIVARLDWEQVWILLTADVEKIAEYALADTDCRADILKVPHHGSATSSTDRFLEAVRPELAIVSTGLRPGREPVHPDVAARYMERGIPMWRTDYSGAIRVTVKDGQITLERARKVRDLPEIGVESNPSAIETSGSK